MNTQKITYALYLLNYINYCSESALNHLKQKNYENFANLNEQITVIHNCAKAALAHQLISTSQFSVIEKAFIQHHNQTQSIYDELEQLLMK